MDPSCPLDKPDCPAKAQSLRLGQTTAPPGEWNLYWDVNGIWGQWKPLVLLARECDLGVLGSFRGQAFLLPPCPRTQEIGNPTGDDYPGAVNAAFPSPSR